MTEEKRKVLRVRTDLGLKYKIRESHSPLKKEVGVDIGEGGIMMKIPKFLSVLLLRVYREYSKYHWQLLYLINDACT